MTQAYNLSQLANFVNSSGQLNATTGITGTAPASTSAASLVSTNFSIVESGGVLYIKHGSTNIASFDASGNFTVIANATSYGTP